MSEYKTYTIPIDVAEVLIRNCQNDLLVEFTKSNGEQRVMRVNSKKTGEYIVENHLEVGETEPNGVIVKTIDINLMTEGDNNPWRAIRLDRLNEIHNTEKDITFIVEQPVEEEKEEDKKFYFIDEDVEGETVTTIYLDNPLEIGYEAEQVGTLHVSLLKSLNNDLTQHLKKRNRK